MDPTIPKKHIPSIVEYEGPFKSSKEYAEALREWLNLVHYHQCMTSAFPFIFAGALQAQQNQQQQSHSTTQNANQNRTQAPVERGKEFILPSLWKRLCAEMIDFFLLFVIKLAATYIAVDFFDLLEMDSQIFESFRSDTFWTDYHTTMNMTWDLLVLETIYRVGNCVFEALCLHRGRGGEGGATPGKKILGLKVVRCNWCAPTQTDQILVYPASDIGIARAFIRAIMKNISITFLFPLCMTMMMYQHNRTIYDVLSGSIVVEEMPPARRTRANNDNNNNNNN